jgi:hypothetical protein
MRQILSPGKRLLAINDAIIKRLEEIDEIVRDVALLLREVYDDKLYLQTHDSYRAWFVHVFKKHWRRGYQLLAWAKLTTIVDNEAQARALGDFPPELQDLVLEEAGGRHASGPQIKEAGERIVIKRQAEREKQEAGADTYREYATGKALDRLRFFADSIVKGLAKIRLDLDCPDHVEEAAAALKARLQEVSPLG